MKRLLAFLAGLFLLAMLLVGGIFVAASDSKPLVERDATISPQAVAQARRVFDRNDPRHLRKGEVRTAVIPASLIDEALNYAATRGFGGRGALALEKQSAELRFTLPLTGDPSPHFLNVAATFKSGDGPPRIAALRLGSIPVPAGTADFLIAFAFRLAGHEREWNLTRDAVRELIFDPAQKLVLIRYVWEPQILDHARAVAVNAEDVPHLREAQSALAAMLDHRSAGKPMPLPVVLKPLLQADAGSVRQRRAALAVLATYLAGKDLAEIVPDASTWPKPKPMNLILMGRHDSAQHFVISAALAAWTGEPLANAIGLYKELDDARHGSGFSFADLAADRAGTRFGDLVIAGDHRIDQLLGYQFGDRDISPALAGLPEYLAEPEFKRIFAGVGSPAYLRMTAEIERRISELPLYR